MPSVPEIISEWASLIPLAFHLASPQDDHITAGEVCLTGRLSVPLFPSLGTMWGLARFLREGTRYFDFASARGGSSRTVWDVNWGSEFLCANAAASTSIADFILKHPRDHTVIAPKRSLPVSDSATTLGSAGRSQDNERPIGHSSKDRESNESPKYRQQILHVYQFQFRRCRRSVRLDIDSIMSSKIGSGLGLVVLGGISILLGLVGAYGSAVLLINIMISKLVAWAITLPRSAGYLRNNEKQENACMLSASHTNATEWSLYIGDRAIVDTILNKPMVYLPEGKQAQLAAHWFKFAHMIQLVAVTYVAAQKGWDGICLLTILCLQYAYQGMFCGDSKAALWLAREGIEVKVRSYEFGWRTAMLGCIQLFSRSKVTRWMDSIIVPHPQRDAFLAQLQGDVLAKEAEARLDQHQLDWINNATFISVQSAEAMRQDFAVGE
ncbi:Herpesvirus glycoprotein N [Penicillium sp. IBT 31633x]|nr:Herpesvirus glycoprotein N [Penicillium sp. IBT 31633x]